MLKFVNFGVIPAAVVKIAFILFSFKNVESFAETKFPENSEKFMNIPKYSAPF